MTTRCATISTVAWLFMTAALGCSSSGSSSGNSAGTAGTSTGGGTNATGGGTGSGGKNASGGSSTGGASTGGSSTGGQGTGGSGTGGSGTGGATGSKFDWTGVVGTGQSLAVGQFGTPAKATTQPYNNLKLSTGSLPWPIDPNNAALKMVPLTEPIGRPSTNYPSSYPTNIAGETPHAAMANQITAMVKAAGGSDYVGVHGEFGENGQCMTYLKKGAPQVGVNGHAYAATVMETTAITRLAKAQNKKYGVLAIIITHGECDAGNAGYENDLYQLWSDYNTDLRAITGQTDQLLMIVSQQNSVNDMAASTLAQWKVGVDHSASVVCSGPKYQYAYHAADHVHLETDGYEMLGEKYAQVYNERVILGHAWQPLQPTTVQRTSTRVITVNFHVPVPPLVWDTTFQAPHSDLPAWSAGKGFEVRAGNGNITISSVTISGDSVQITCASDLPATGVNVSYAMYGSTAAMSTPFVGTFRWGQLKDSDPFVGAVTKKAQPNYCVAFQMPVP